MKRLKIYEQLEAHPHDKPILLPNLFSVTQKVEPDSRFDQRQLIFTKASIYSIEARIGAKAVIPSAPHSINHIELEVAMDTTRKLIADEIFRDLKEEMTDLLRRTMEQPYNSRMIVDGMRRILDLIDGNEVSDTFERSK